MSYRPLAGTPRARSDWRAPPSRGFLRRRRLPINRPRRCHECLGLPLAAASGPDCVVELDGVAASTQVDVLSPEHESATRRAKPFPVWRCRPGLSTSRRGRRAALRRPRRAGAGVHPVQTRPCRRSDLRLGEHVVEAYLALDNQTRLDCNLEETTFRVNPRGTPRLFC